MRFIQMVEVFFIKCWYAVDDILYRAFINCYALPDYQFSVICHSGRFAEVFSETALYKVVFVDVLPIAKARGFWDTNEPCYQMTVLRVLSAMDNALPIFIYYLREKKIRSPSFFIFIAAFKSLS